ncbi:MAG: hypothetical protein M1819_002912 [Sarea resinae]|nr:MAG: hypothetical protein M1819_002912 [Sarea resinae]
MAFEQTADLCLGFFHPIIHLGFGVEFEQPAIIAEALAQTAVHDTWPSLLLQGAERAAGDRNGKPGSKSLVQLLDEVRADPKLSTSAHWSDGHKIRNGIYERAPKQMIQYASQWTVGPEQLEEKTAEMLNAAVYSAGGAQHPPKQVKFDFLLIHDVNCSIFFSAFLKQAWLSPQVKARLLEWKGRMDLAMYVSRGSPKLLLEEIKNYQPKEKPNLAGDSWGGIFGRASAFEDDGHTSKLVRTLAHGEEICRPFESLGSFRVKGDMWLKLGNMAIDSVEDCGDQWVRSAGFDEAWEKFEDRPRAQL